MKAGAEVKLMGRCPVKECTFKRQGDAETLSSVLAMHLRDDHDMTAPEATLTASEAVKRGQETAFKVDRMELVLTEVFGSATPVQARAVLRALSGHGLMVRVVDGTRMWG